MDNNRINNILSQGFNEIDNDLKVHEEIREVAQELAQRLMWEQAINEYITNEHGEQSPYTFMLESTVKIGQSVPTVTMYVINIHHMEQASRIPGKQYRPAKYEAELSEEFDKQQVVQTLLSTAIASIKGVILVGEVD